MYENSGRLFKNDRKTPGGSQPDYTGDLTDASGKKWRLAAWIKDGRDGGKWMSLKLSEPQDERQPDPEPAQRPAEQDGPLPF